MALNYYDGIYTRDIIVLINIGEKFEKFCKEYKELKHKCFEYSIDYWLCYFVEKKISEDNKKDNFIIERYYNEFKEFVESNSEAINIINKYSDMVYFLNHYFDELGNPVKEVNDLYLNINNNKEDEDKIIDVIAKINTLNFEKIYFDKDYDFSKRYTRYYEKNRAFYYSNKFDILNEEKKGCIFYTISKDANYLLSINVNGKNDLFIRNLDFDSKDLPDDLSKKMTIDKIVREYNKWIYYLKMKISYDNLSKSFDEFTSDLMSKENISEEAIKILKWYKSTLNSLGYLNRGLHSCILEESEDKEKKENITKLK